MESLVQKSFLFRVYFLSQEAAWEVRNLWVWNRQNEIVFRFLRERRKWSERRKEWERKWPKSFWPSQGQTCKVQWLMNLMPALHFRSFILRSCHFWLRFTAQFEKNILKLAKAFSIPYLDSIFTYDFLPEFLLTWIRLNRCRNWVRKELKVGADLCRIQSWIIW